MQLNVTVNKVTITESSIFNSGEYGVNSIQFTFSEEYEGLAKRAIFTTPENKSFLVSIVDDECVIPEEALKLQGNVFIGVYAYQNEDDNLILRYSPSPVKFFIDNGSYVETKKTAVPPEALQDIYIKIEQFINDVQQQIDDGDFDGVGISNIVFDSNYVMTITMTDGTIYTSPSLKGDTPQKGVDYWTEEDKQEIITEVEGHIPTKVSELENDSQFIDNTVDDLVNYSTTSSMNTAIGNAVGTETTARQNADLNMQQQIDAITSASDVVDVVGTYTDLENYITSGLTADDVVKVLQDSTHNNALSYYRWKLVNTIGEWQYIGSEGPFYTKGESDSLLNAKQNTIDNSNKLNADLVDDSTSTNKFVTASDKTNWNAKVSDTDYATSSKGGVIKTSTTNNFAITPNGNPACEISTYDNYVNKDSYLFIGKGTLENVITGKELVNATQLNTKEDKSSLVTGEGEIVSLNNTSNLKFMQPPLPKGNTKQAQSILPEGFTQLEYIQSTGTQYINTGVKPNSTIEFDITFNTSNIFTYGSGYGCIFGSRESFGTNELQLTTYISEYATDWGGTIRYASNLGSNAYLSNNEKINVKLKDGKYYVNGEEKQSISISTTNDYPLALFALNSGGSIVQYGSIKLYSFKLYRNGALLGDYIPCRNSTGSVGLYDLASHVFNSNRGTGEFIAGPEVTLPTPEYPIDITNVTGDAEVVVCDKNLALNDDPENPDANYKSSGGGTTIVQYSSTEGGYYTTGHRRRSFGILKPGSYAFSITAKARSEGSSAYTILTSVKGYSDSVISKSLLTNEYNRFTYAFTISEDKEFYITFYDTLYWKDIQLEVNSTATTYIPHQEQTLPLTLGEIELCKIGTAQDYFYKDNGKWYLHKEIGKVILNGTETWYDYSPQYTGYYTGYTSKHFGRTGNFEDNFYCNYFQNLGLASDNPCLKGTKYATYIKIPDNIASDMSELKTWLSSNNVIVYYLLDTPTTTEITDTTLINQLEAISNATSYEGETNIFGSSDESNPLFEVQAVQYKEPDYWTIAYVNGQIGDAIGGAY